MRERVLLELEIIKLAQHLLLFHILIQNKQRRLLRRWGACSLMGWETGKPSIGNDVLMESTNHSPYSCHHNVWLEFFGGAHHVMLWGFEGEEQAGVFYNINEMQKCNSAFTETKWTETCSNYSRMVPTVQAYVGWWQLYTFIFQKNKSECII